MGTHWSCVPLPTLNLLHTLWCPEPLSFLRKLPLLSFSVPKVVPTWCEGDGWWPCVTSPGVRQLCLCFEIKSSGTKVGRLRVVPHSFSHPNMSNLISIPRQLLEKFPRAPCFGLGFVRKCGAVKAEELCGNGMVLTRLSSGEVSELQDRRADQTQTHWGRQATLSQLSKESQAQG